MRLALLSHEYPPAVGGLATFAGHLAPALAAAGLDVHVISVARGERDSASDEDGVTVHRGGLIGPRGLGRVTTVPEAAGCLLVSMSALRLMRARDVRPDVIHAPAARAEGWASMRAGFPTVAYLHSFAYEVAPWRGVRPHDRALVRMLEHRAVRGATGLAGPAAFVADIAPGLGVDPASVEPVPNPVPVGPLVAGPGEERVLFLGRIEPRKRPDVILRAIPAVRALIPGVRFVFAGSDVRTRDGSMVGALRSLAERLGVGGSVEFTDGGSMSAELARARVVVCPSTVESFSYIAAESAAVGRPVIASAVPSMAEVVEDGQTGVLVPPGDVGAWADAMIELLARPEVSMRMGRAARDRVAARFDPNEVAARLIRVYERAAASGRIPA